MLMSSEIQGRNQISVIGLGVGVVCGLPLIRGGDEQFFSS